ncbi:MAG: hypothetical protein ACOH2H_07100 [Cypionkella sp.]
MIEPFLHRPPPAKVAVIGGMMAYFEKIMGPGFRDERRDHVSRVIGPLGPEFAITPLGLWAESADTDAIARQLVTAAPEVLLLVPTMATPPAEIAGMAQKCGVPVVIACAHELSAVEPGYDMTELCRHSVNVGAAMLGSMLRRYAAARPPVLVSGFLDDPTFHARLALALRTAALAHRLQGLRIGRLGQPMPGYDHIGLSDEEATASGLHVVDIPLAEWADRVRAVKPNEIRQFVQERLPALVPPQTRIEPGDGLDRAARLALALDRIANDQGLSCGSLTCRGPFGVGLNDGAIGCLATSLMTQSGRPFSATGDLLTAIAMHVGKALGGATLYCELDAVDRGREAFLVANTGEGDFDWCPPDGATAIVDARAYSGRDVPGVVLSHDLSEGPATMLGVVLDRSTTDRLGIVAMQGETLEPARTALNVTHGWFRTTGKDALVAFEGWANAGATHHGALSRGHLAEAIGWLGKYCRWPATTLNTGDCHD